MTENELRQMVANNMRGWIGLKRSDRSHMVIINLYNSCLPLARGYRVTATDDYCATGASAAGIKAGLTDIIPRECSCGYMIQLFQKTLHSNMFLLILRLETELTKNNNLYIPICFY